MAEARYPPCETPRCPECGAITVFQERQDAPFQRATDYRFACSDYMECGIWTSVFVPDED